MTTPAYQLVDEAVFNALRQILIARTGKGITSEEVRLMNVALSTDDPKQTLPAPAKANDLFTLRGVTEIFGHEAIIREMYLDSVKVETWAAGLTANSGINVRQYKDNPTSMQECVTASIGRMRVKYGPRVLAAFAGKQLTEAQFHAALSFDWNTGAIHRADWVKHWMAGRITDARASFMNWKSPPEIVERREKERDLFFDGKWSGDGTVTEYKVNKPSYTPKWSSARKVDVSAEIRKALS